VIGKGKPKKLGAKFAPVSMCAPRIAYEVERGIEQKAEVRSQCLSEPRDEREDCSAELGTILFITKLTA